MNLRLFGRIQRRQRLHESRSGLLSIDNAKLRQEQPSGFVANPLWVTLKEANPSVHCVSLRCVSLRPIKLHTFSASL